MLQLYFNIWKRSEENFSILLYIVTILNIWKRYIVTILNIWKRSREKNVSGFTR